MTLTHTLQQIFENLLNEYGSQSWWPADSPFEVMVGAILTQNTAWSSVEKAIAGLKDVCEMTPGSLLSVPLEDLEQAIRPSGYFRQKAERLQTLCRFLNREYGGDPGSMEPVPTLTLRRQLLDLKGVGPETADSILLYALDRAVFVVDAYTVRLVSRLGLCGEDAGYREVQAVFMDSLVPDTGMFNEYHALIVRHGKERCRKRDPVCGGCALGGMCVFNLRSQISNLR